MSEGGWDDGNLYMHERGVFGVLAFDSFKAVTFHGWVADLDKSGKLIVPYWALQEMGHGMARYSSGLGFELYICASGTIRTGR